MTGIFRLYMVRSTFGIYGGHMIDTVPIHQFNIIWYWFNGSEVVKLSKKNMLFQFFPNVGGGGSSNFHFFPNSNHSSLSKLKIIFFCFPKIHIS